MQRLRTFTSIAALGAAASGLLVGCAPSETTEDVAEAQSPLGQPFVSESEPNATSAQATPIGNDVVVRANVYPAADQDVFAFQAPAGARVYAAIMSSFTASLSTDADLEILGTDGTTVLEADDNNGVLSGSSPSIAGTALPAAGTYYARATYKAGANTLRPYDLHLKVQTGLPTAETEPNDMVAQPMPASGWAVGTLSSAADIDAYAITIGAGDTIFASLDLDPTRDGTEFNGALAIGPISGVNFGINDAGTTGPDSEAFFVTPQAAGTYAIIVTGAAAGDYALSVSVHPATSAVGCTTYTSADVPKTIPAVGGQITSTITVPGTPRIGDINVNVKLNHTLMTDLDAHLVSPAGNTNGLFTDIGSATFPNLDVTIDDEGAFPISFFTTSNGLVAQPEADYRMKWLQGENAGGVWTLTLNDDTNNANGGTLTGWSMTICDQPIPAVTCAGGVAPVTALSTDFENGANGFTHTGTLDTWALGTPSVAPITNCNSGTQCWKTNLAGTYTALSSQDLKSAPIDLTQKKSPIQLKWAMKYQMESATYDHAWVEIREVGGANPRRLWEWVDATMSTSVGLNFTTLNESAGWSTQFADVSSYAGKQVELVFHVDGDDTVQMAGLAVDDVSVVGCPNQICGNNILEAPETCDDGNLVNGDGCDSNCKPTGCGNGIITMGETCDDGNVVSGDGCDANCKPTGCGNGIATAGEACDDGNAVNGDGCDTNCTVSACGNNIKAPNEACDDGNLVDGDGCDSNCTATACGNNIKTMGEACDDGNLTDGDGCDSNCTATACGNNIVTMGEACDDGNLTDGDGCDSNCTATACGNGIVTLGEMCDDGNGVLGDGCDDGMMGNCTPSSCGNGVLAGGEGCDDGNVVDADGCDSNCTMTGCGNGVLTLGEDCDDGNAMSGDGCDNNCTETGCGNAVQTDGEACDDGNLDEGDGCDTNCTLTACGNGIVSMGEDCDDSNQVDGDGCDSNCTQTGCGNGVKTDGEACDDGNAVDGDDCDTNCTLTACGNGVVTAGEQCDDANTVSGDGCSADCKDEGAGGAGGGGAGGSATGGGGAGGATGGSATGGAGAGTTGGTGGSGGVQAEGGCGCRVPGEDKPASPWAAVIAMAAIGAMRLRRRRAAK